MGNTHCTIWNIVRNNEKREKWEMHTVGPGIWRENWKTWKKRHKDCLTLNMATNNEKDWKWEMHTVGLEMSQEILKNE